MKPTAINRFALDGKVALVTGASSGLGRHFAQLLSQSGARVVLAARRVSRLEEDVQTIEGLGGQARAVAMDVTNAASVSACFNQLADWGQDWAVPDVLVNNAGVTVTRSLLEQTEDDWDQVMNTNLKGNWLVGTEAARRMVAAKKGGAIVNVASILGMRVAGGVAPYAVSKAGVVQATKAMALELARHQIRVNALLPGYIATDLNKDFLESELGERLRARIPSRRFGVLTDLDGPLLLLASDAGAAMSGACIAVDGAHLVSSL
ncbi:SDR family NAD(P)-dependent oxidoreductase [Alcaligenes endophyticus]|uniref:SDR family oxidoreductase n=1 Tax=Alcaligenes endophyticus TaxID=1929088 RepID=A0ABT8EGE0_9BURK|nr:SDR family oxidoreductase [Alcaligenes endophyticus]MCX5589980.1 SDR family oxidoreductase [Alcaligenes endophyticus]MDN4120357.1 SDR family oxidoreductase [Alcaligenes endophyticus]